MAVCNCAKLDNTYLPPPDASNSGGNGLAPPNQGNGFNGNGVPQNGNNNGFNGNGAPQSGFGMHDSIAQSLSIAHEKLFKKLNDCRATARKSATGIPTTANCNLIL